MPNSNDIKKTEITIANKTIVRVILLVGISVLGLVFVWATRQVWILLTVAFFLTLALNPPVSFLAKKLPKRSRGLATAISYLVVLALLSLLAFTIAPPLINQSRELINELPTYIDNIETSDHPVAQWFQQHGIADELKLTKDQIVEGLSTAGTPLLNVFKRISTSVVSVLVVLVLTFLMLVEGPNWLERFWSFHHKSKVKHRKELAKRMYHVVTGYVNGQMLVAFIAALTSFLMLVILGVDFALPLAAIVGLLGLIPLVGATIGGILLVIVGLFNSLATGIILLVFFIIYQQFENYVIHPAIQARTLEISPLLILVAAIFGVTLAGLLGALLAIPAAASLRILVNDYIEHHHLVRNS